jgi:hypothetical protein
MHYNLRVTSWALFEEIISLGLHKDVLNPHCEMITTCMFTYVLDLKSEESETVKTTKGQTTIYKTQHIK